MSSSDEDMEELEDMAVVATVATATVLQDGNASSDGDDEDDEVTADIITSQSDDGDDLTNDIATATDMKSKSTQDKDDDEGPSTKKIKLEVNDDKKEDTSATSKAQGKDTMNGSKDDDNNNEDDNDNDDEEVEATVEVIAETCTSEDARSSTPVIEAEAIIEDDDDDGLTPMHTPSTTLTSLTPNTIATSTSFDEKDIPSVRTLGIPFRAIKRTMKLAPDIATVQNEAAMVTTYATELLLKKLAENACMNAKKRGRNTIRYEDVSEVRSHHEQLNFLETLLP